MHNDQLIELLRNPKLFSAETAVEIESLTKEFPWFQFAWMLFARNLKQIGSPQFEPVLKKAAVQVPNRKLLFDFLNEENPLTSVNLRPERTFLLSNDNHEGQNEGGSSSLIDKYLMGETSSIGRKPFVENQAGQENAKNLVEKSTSENDELITETLANIYFQQKKYEKALHAYQKLSLKYPEKSIYFASRIKEIEDLTHNNY